MKSFLMLIARICLSAVFVLAGLGKIVFDYENTLVFMESKGIMLAPILLYVAGLVEIVGGLSILFGYKIRYGVTLLTLYLVVVTLVVHSFWNYEGAMRTVQLIQFLSNLAIIGGLLYVYTTGAGRYSYDNEPHPHD